MRCGPLAFVLPLLVTTAAPMASAQEVSVTPSGEYFMRFRHFEGRDYAPGGVVNFVRHRARIGLELAYGDAMSAFFQVQDVRTWGEEGDTLRDFSADGLDMHQAYGEVGFGDDVRLRFGRQEIGYLNHRLIGNVGFQEQGRSFDAVRLMAMAMDRQLALDFFYARTSHALLPPNVAATDDVFGLAARMQVGSFFQPAIVSVLDLGSGVDRVRSTTGVVLALEYPWGLKASLEGYLQAGSAEPDLSILAWMSAARVRFTLVDSELAPFLEVFAQLLSGDDTPGDTDVTTFDTLFATNHRFYGEADVFVNMPVDTANRGLVDIGGVIGMNLIDIVTAQIAVHVFQTMASQGGPSLYGIEIDTTIGLRPSEHLFFDMNHSVVVPGEALSALEEPLAEHFFYFTLGTKF